jgi:hypothetical protein
MNIKFNTITTFSGRNGLGKCSGVAIEHMHYLIGQTVWISPLTSRGDIANCHIGIPVDDVPSVVKELKKYLRRKKK